jgi:hypothetical protein
MEKVVSCSSEFTIARNYQRVNMNDSMFIKEMIFYFSNNPGSGLKDFLVVIGVIIGAFLTFISSYILERHKHKSEYEKQKLNMMWKSFSELKGLQAALSQNVFDFYHVQIMSVFSEKGYQLVDEEYKETFKKNNEKSTEIYQSRLSKLTDNKQRLFEIVGLVFLLYPNTNELKDRINPLYTGFNYFSKFETNNLRFEVVQIESFNELKFWQNKLIDDLKEKTKDNISQPIGELLNYLQENIDSFH